MTRLFFILSIQVFLISSANAQFDDSTSAPSDSLYDSSLFSDDSDSQPAANSLPVCVTNAADLSLYPSLQAVASVYNSTWKGDGTYHGTLGSYPASLTIKIRQDGTYVASGCANIPLIGRQCQQKDHGTVQVCEDNGVITMSSTSRLGKPAVVNQYDPNNPTFTVPSESDHSDFVMYQAN